MHTFICKKSKIIQKCTKKNIKVTFTSLCVHACLHVECQQWGVGVPVSARVKLSVFLCHFLPCFLEKGSVTELEACCFC